MTQQPFRFAVALEPETTPSQLKDVARKAEGLGYSALLCSDHLHQRVSALAGVLLAAECTTTLHVVTYVLNMDLRNPAVVAREAQTIHEVTRGRFTIGMGAGWLRSDYTDGGVPFAPGPERAARFEKAVGIVSDYLGLTGGEAPATEWSQTGDALPRRLPRMLIGAGGRRLLSFAARRADIVSFTPASTADGSVDVRDTTTEAYDRKYAWIRAAAGTRIDSIEINQVTWECLVTPRPDPVIAAFASSMGMPPESVRQMPCLLIGSVAQIAEALLSRRERWGVSLVTVPSPAIEAFAPVVERLNGR